MSSHRVLAEVSKKLRGTLWDAFRADRDIHPHIVKGNSDLLSLTQPGIIRDIHHIKGTTDVLVAVNRGAVSGGRIQKFSVAACGTAPSPTTHRRWGRFSSEKTDSFVRYSTPFSLALRRHQSNMVPESK